MPGLSYSEGAFFKVGEYRVYTIRDKICVCFGWYSCDSVTAPISNYQVYNYYTHVYVPSRRGGNQTPCHF